MALFYSDRQFEIEAVIEIMRIRCEDWNTRLGEINGQVIGIRDESKATIEIILDICERILDKMFTGEDSSAFKKVAAFMVVSTIYPFLFARVEGDTDGLYGLAGNSIQNFQALFNVESAPLLLSLAEQVDANGQCIRLEPWTGFATKEAIEENWKFLINIPKVARTEPGVGIEFDARALGVQILALSLILENAYLAGVSDAS